MSRFYLYYPSRRKQPPKLKASWNMRWRVRASVENAPSLVRLGREQR